MPATGAEGIVLRCLETEADRQACLGLQRRTWGEDPLEWVPPRMLAVSQLVGGLVAGAFAGDELAGFVYSLCGQRDGHPAHWSHMLAVLPAYRDRGVGRRLKLFQRDVLLEQGVDRCYWTFDPLVARNAHFNLNRLGVEVREYVVDYYGAGEGNLQFSGIGSDRFIVVWNLTGTKARQALAGELPGDLSAFAGAPVVNAAPGPGGTPGPGEAEAPEAPAVRIEVPPDVQALKRRSKEQAAAWRASTRRAFTACFERGLRSVFFFRDPGSGRHFYGLC